MFNSFDWSWFKNRNVNNINFKVMVSRITSVKCSTLYYNYSFIGRCNWFCCSFIYSSSVLCMFDHWVSFKTTYRKLLKCYLRLKLEEVLTRHFVTFFLLLLFLCIMQYYNLRIHIFCRLIYLAPIAADSGHHASLLVLTFFSMLFSIQMHWFHMTFYKALDFISTKKKVEQNWFL